MFHERTDDPRVMQFHFYLNPPELLALWSPIESQTSEQLTSLSPWMHDFAVEWGYFWIRLNQPELSAVIALRPGTTITIPKGGDAGISAYASSNA